MLEELSKRDKVFRAMAYSICGSRSLSDDLVQDMYLKIYEAHKRRPDLKVTDFYIYQTMKSIFIDIKRKQREYPTDDFSLLDNSDCDRLEQRKQLIELLSVLTIPERECLIITFEMSLRKAADELGIVSYSWVRNYKNKAFEKLLKENNIELK